MKIVGICGYIGHGKSTFAEMLTAIDPEHSVHHETSHVVVELANAFNALLHEQYKSQSLRSDIAAIEQSVRAIVPEIRRMASRTIADNELDIDTDDVTANPQWYDKLQLYVHQVDEKPDLLRTTITKNNKNDYRSLLQWIGGYVLYKLNDPSLWYRELVTRAAAAGPSISLAALTAPRLPAEALFVQAAGGVVLRIYDPRKPVDSSDVTERYIAEIEADSIITNNDTLAGLQAVAAHVQQDIFANALQPTYTAKP